MNASINTATIKPKITIITSMGRLSHRMMLYTASISKILSCSLKFCTEMEWPADKRTWQRCFSSALIGTTKKQDKPQKISSSHKKNRTEERSVGKESGKKV